MEDQLLKLDPSNKEKILKFWNSRRDLYGRTIEPDEAASLRKFQYYFELHPGRFHLYAILDSQGDIVFTLGTALWDALPYYSFIDMYSLPTIRSSNKIKDFMSRAINQLLIDMLALKRHTFYYVFERSHVAPEVEWDPNHSHSYIKFISESHKYDYSTELILKPGEKPKFVTYWKLIGRKTHPVELVIRRGNLKPQYMKELLSL